MILLFSGLPKDICIVSFFCSRYNSELNHLSSIIVLFLRFELTPPVPSLYLSAKLSFFRHNLSLIPYVNALKNLQIQGNITLPTTVRANIEKLSVSLHFYVFIHSTVCIPPLALQNYF